MLQQYFTKVQELLDVVLAEEQQQMKKTGDLLAKTIENDGVIYMFGSGHSHILTEEVFYRAGGLAPVYPILIEPLMLHLGAAASSQNERKNDYVRSHLEGYPISDRDALIVISTSGLNPVPVDVALFARERGAIVMAITSTAYAATQHSRHKAGLFLKDAADIVLDNHVPEGDAVLGLPETLVKFASVSSIVGIAMIQGMLAECISKLSANNADIPVFKSGNVTGADDYNSRLLEQFSEKIPLLTENMEI
ncbi:putative sugar isomerase [Paenibacillus larvae subsp. larvae]|uniref:UPF0309 protein ERICIII_03024 n=2 Tax=Paenibacillus larvae TaxID=1464 RepID=A0A2L1U2K4_9BACL|nr:SIS domain-containing protein [Paenibacillus larvae]AQT83794.1 hypothetical protein B1222_04260 [Paenibacillus larvae subsp. pulvifaciens]AQZ45224.1 hypothetical protein B5S25_00100 [Paenibacillus larvae subsp. pulvifaciens]AVF27151.1 putative sugar isomerase [Paenibacillus larvae subsp. larvae]AVF31812.1 putative sugar isomerase [Paenibacillus larvae subsp. larvae]MBH0341171.1 hypothetical protein [Paenibacillus larvae]